MALIEIRIPQLGEGLQEARLVRLLKRPGDAVAKDEPVFEMETDKAAMEIEAPGTGVLAEWTAEEGAVLPIGAVIGLIRPDGPRQEPPTPRAGPAAEPTDGLGRASGLRNADASPRTRAYARASAVDDASLASLAASLGGKPLPADIDQLLLERAPGGTPAGGAAAGQEYEDLPLAPAQRALLFRLVRASQAAIPATIETPVDWSALEEARARLRRQARARGERPPAQFLLFAWCVARAAARHPRFRSILVNDSALRQYAHLNLGIAVAREDDELVTARIDAADALDFVGFLGAATDAVETARRGVDQASNTMHVTLTSLSAARVRSGTPVVVPPSVATLFVGTPYDEARPRPDGGVSFRRVASAVLTFDHRVVNGMGAARFLAEIRSRVAALPADFPG